MAVYAHKYTGDHLVRALLERGADANGHATDGLTPLMCAALCGIPEVVSLLIAAGADVNAVSQRGGMPLSLAYLNHARVKTEEIETLDTLTFRRMKGLSEDFSEMKRVKATTARAQEVIDLLYSAGAKS
jgi:ankyrin repeat protein